MNCDFSEWYKGKCGGTFYHSHTVLYSHHFTLNNVSKYHANDNYNAVMLQHLAGQNQLKLNV
jgi:hypothetical protein